MITITYLKKACLSTSLFVLLLSCQTKTYQPVETSALENLENLYQEDLDIAIHSLATLERINDLDSLEQAFQKARQDFKSIEPILSFQDVNNYNTLNAPNILKVEEEDATDIKIKEPKSYQTLEEEIFGDQPNVETIQALARAIKLRLQLVQSSTDISHYKPYHVLWIVRKQIVRTALTGVTGFDSPMLESSLDDGVTAFAKARQIMELYKNQFKDPTVYQHWNDLMDQAQKRLEMGDFANFDRYRFLKETIDPLLAHWTNIAKDWEINFPLELAITNNATSLFSKETLSLDYFADYPTRLTAGKIALGKQLFNDTRLSGTGMVSCATCHLEARAFTDGLEKSIGQMRNSPSLTYAGYQRGFFYDKRSGSLEGQIISVINSETEFHSDIHQFTASIEKDRAIQKQFEQAYQQPINELTVRTAIADYVRSLNDWDSKWDRNMRAEENTLTTSEINGFNLFMGKAKCATCHFAPVFNGTVPPDYSDTEMEHLGVPLTNQIANATIDPDTGRFQVMGTNNRKYFFKTPSLRNVAMTAPYMHNGVYQTLEQVVDFYNRGGGYGIGIIDQEYQTLPPDPLNLTPMEQQDLVNFMHTLTDARYEKTIPLGS